jgi:hypothetical protein
VRIRLDDLLHHTHSHMRNIVSFTSYEQVARIRLDGLIVNTNTQLCQECNKLNVLLGQLLGPGLSLSLGGNGLIGTPLGRETLQLNTSLCEELISYTPCRSVFRSRAIFIFKRQ